MKNNRAAFDMAEKAGTDTGSLARALDQSGEVGQHEFLVMPAHDPDGATT